MRKRTNNKVVGVRTVKPGDVPNQPFHKPLGNEVEQGGFLHKLVKRENDIAIFSKERIEKNWCDFYYAGYEVIIIKRHNGYTLGGVYLPPSETYPCTSLFGILAWACMTLEAAEARFRWLKAKLAAREISVDEDVTEVDE